MSLSLYMHPIEPPPPRTYLGGHPAKGVLVKAFGEGDGSLRTEFVLSEEHDGRTLDVLVRLHPDIEQLREAREYLRDNKLVRFWTDE